MNKYEELKQLSPQSFRRLTKVKRKTFDEMIRQPKNLLKLMLHSEIDYLVKSARNCPTD